MNVKVRYLLVGLLVLMLVVSGCKGRKAIPDLPAEEEILLLEAEYNATVTDTGTVTGTLTSGAMLTTTTESEPAAEATAEATQAPQPTATTAPATQEVATPQVEATTEPVAAATPEPAPAAAGEKTHVVQAGQNLFRIALMYGVSVEAVAAANNITNPAMISVGQVLKIPAGGGSTQPDVPVQPGGKTYVVKAGDNLFRIALRYGFDQYYLARYNGIDNPALIYVGQVLRIP